MMRSLFSGVTGLRNHQTRMDTIGNNIANVNTVGFKGSRTIFQDLFSQNIQVAAGASATTGGTNAIQIGLGVGLSTIDLLMTRGSSQYTGNGMDLMIEGEGFFVVQNGAGSLDGEGQTYYTRAGNLYVDNQGWLTTGSGDFVMVRPPNPTFDEAYVDPTNPLYDPTHANAQKFLAGSKAVQIDADLYKDISINPQGEVWVLDDSNQKVLMGAIELAGFSNPAGLEKVGGNKYIGSNNSGPALTELPGTKNTGPLKSGTLEMSNVDLANEFTDMIITQRGFQANSRIITTSDSMLEELVNLKR